MGLRKDELARIKVEDIMEREGHLVAYVRSGKGGRPRYAPVLPGREAYVLAVVEGRKPEERIFAKLPDTDIHALRREYAQAFYFYYAPDCPPLPPASERILKPSDYDRAAAMKVSEALGHSRLDVVLRDYLR